MGVRNTWGENMSDPHQSKYTTQTFGDRLRELSNAKESYSKIARDLGINRQQFARYINGTSLPRDALVKKMAEYFQVESGAFFQNHPFPSGDEGTSDSGGAVTSALLEGMAHLEQEVITEAELPSGFYMQHKQSFTQPDKVLCMMSLVYRNRRGVTRCKRRYSILVTRELPSVRVSHTSYGVFVKNLGTILLFESDGVAGDFVFSAFKPASMFSIADRVKTGVVMTHGRPGSLGPVAGRHIIERIPGQDSKLAWARRQGFRSVEDLPDYIQYFFQPPASVPSSVMAVR